MTIPYVCPTCAVHHVVDVRFDGTYPWSATLAREVSADHSLIAPECPSITFRVEFLISIEKMEHQPA